jgi:hypothetical protein
LLFRNSSTTLPVFSIALDCHKLEGLILGEILEKRFSGRASSSRRARLEILQAGYPDSHQSLATRKSQFHTCNGPTAKSPLAGHTTLGPALLKPFSYVLFLFIFSEQPVGPVLHCMWCSSGSVWPH